MIWARAKFLVAGGILLIFTIAALHYNSVQIIPLAPLSNLLNFKSSEEVFNINRKKLSNVQPLEPAKFDNQSDVKCPNAKLGNLSFPMCIYDPSNDVIVSKMILAGQFFEANLVQKFLAFFRKHPDVTFVDLGANLGTYSLPIAHSGVSVVSVEPNRDTVRRLAKSVHLGRIEKNINVLNYALSNEETTSFLRFDSSNRGDTFMVGNGSCPGCLSTKVTVLNNLVPFIRYKKVFIKIDTQGAEIMTFQRKSAAQFFDEIDVVMIQMEWVLYPERYGKTEDRRRKVDSFLEFFFQRGYDVYDPRTEQKQGTDWTKWTYDVLFKKEGLPKDQLFAIS